MDLRDCCERKIVEEAVANLRCFCGERARESLGKGRIGQGCCIVSGQSLCQLPIEQGF